MCVSLVTRPLAGATGTVAGGHCASAAADMHVDTRSAENTRHIDDLFSVDETLRSVYARGWQATNRVGMVFTRIRDTRLLHIKAGMQVLEEGRKAERLK